MGYNDSDLVEIRWDGWYLDYDGCSRHCDWVTGRFPRYMIEDISNNYHGLLEQWLRKAIPDFCRLNTHSGYYIHTDD